MPDRTTAPPTQFSLRWIFGITTLFGAMFAVLAALGISPADALVGFVAIIGGSLATAAAVELIARLAGYRSTGLPG
mgnify:CR=1 FL=1